MVENDHKNFAYVGAENFGSAFETRARKRATETENRKMEYRKSQTM